MSEPSLQKRRAQGCLIAFVGMGVLTLTPAVGRFVDISPQLATGILIVALGLLVVGAALGIVGASDDEESDDPGGAGH